MSLMSQTRSFDEAGFTSGYPQSGNQWGDLSARALACNVVWLAPQGDGLGDRDSGLDSHFTGKSK